VASGLDIAGVALSMLGVPYHHDGRSREGGVDCLGLAVLCLQELGLPVQDRVGVPQHQDIWPEIIERVELHADQVDGELEPGDLLLFRGRLMNHHAAIYVSSGEMVHAFSSVGRVVAQPLDVNWLSRLAGAYRFRGLG
jgi:cell wall-associated NlpC family hydrolase